MKAAAGGPEKHGIAKTRKEVLEEMDEAIVRWQEEVNKGSEFAAGFHAATAHWMGRLEKLDVDRKAQAERDKRLADLSEHFDKLHSDFIQSEREGEEDNGHEIAVYDLEDWDKLTDRLKGYTEVLAHLAAKSQSSPEEKD